MNEEITKFLNEYVEISDPQYAVMLKGAWGCGKTFFIQQWIKTLKEKGKRKKGKKLEWIPIYVSLYGMTSVQQITEGINKEIYPWLYSKGATLIKNVLKTASKIALKYDIDVDKNGKSEGSATFNLDSILLLKGDNKEIEGNKILIFDDFERCNVNFETLLGYINYFSEHCKCKVIIIGDETKLKEKENGSKTLKFKDFKEKTIGRTFEIKANIDETVDFFIQELSSNDRNLFSENKELIIQIFQASKFNNLRILRQCLNDYNRIVMSLPESYHKSTKYRKIITSLLANFIAVYCEYKSGNTHIAKLFGVSTMFNDSDERKEREQILSKYRFIRISQGLGIFDDFIVDKIIHYLDYGSFDTDYLQQYFTMADAEIKSWEHLYDYWRLSNKEYEKYYNETIAYYSKDQCQDLKELFIIISILSVLSSLGLVSVSEDEIIAQGKKSINRLMSNINELKDLLGSNKLVHSGLRPIYDSQQAKLRNVLLQYFKAIFDDRVSQCPNKMSVTLEDLDDESCERLGIMLNEVVPMKDVLYRDTPFFESVNPQKVATRIIGLSNEAKNTFYQFLLYRYDRASNGSEIAYVPSKYIPDIPNLILIGKSLEGAAEHSELIERFALRKIVTLIEEISKRVEKP